VKPTTERPADGATYYEVLTHTKRDGYSFVERERFDSAGEARDRYVERHGLHTEVELRIVMWRNGAWRSESMIDELHPRGGTVEQLHLVGQRVKG
jgi:hypothetical protein